MQIRIINRSAWPTPALGVLCRWLCKLAAFDNGKSGYTFVFRDTRNTAVWRGRGALHKQTITMHRHFQPPSGWPWRARDPRFQWATEEVYRNRLEALVGLMGHELGHAMDGRPELFEKNGRVDRARMEFRCNRAGQRAVEALRRDWPLLRSAIQRVLRRGHARAAVAQAAARGRRYDPERKLVHAQQMLKQWSAKLKLAQTKIRRYRKQVAYYERRAAAKRGFGTAVQAAATSLPASGTVPASRPDGFVATPGPQGARHERQRV
jgi:hypothetical protein